ncbi:MAG: hypothetical protein L6422_10995 [Candidatus Marinimicrobia bacterium]|nr:hypothetical protein [bacterium]MCG2716773.1 hypothetical protein [Candidatus Neomarinimicrobiota bacterium]
MLHNIIYLKRIYICISLFYISLYSATTEEILVTNDETEQRLEYANNNYLQNPENILIDMKNILLEYPNNARAHQIRGKVYYRAIGDIEKSVSELITTQNLLSQIPFSGDSINPELRKTYSLIKGEIDLILPNIEDYFADLRMKIRGLTISRLCRIENARIVFQYHRRIYEEATIEQQLRLLFLEKELLNATFQFSEWDSLNQEMYFAIKYFPVVVTNIEQPYAITINNEQRYHFDLLGPGEPPVEINWSNQYRLVNSLPDMIIELTHSKDIQIEPIYPKGAIVTRPYFALSETRQLKNSYVPVLENANVDIRLLEGYPGQKSEKALFSLSKILTGVIIASIFFLIR